MSQTLRLATACACLFSVLCAGYAAWRQDWTYDEPFHLGWSQRLLSSRVTERDSQERYNSKTPAAIPNALAQRIAAGLGASSPRALRFAARLPTVAWLALLLALLFAGSRRLLGERAAHVATIGAALDPNLIAHGSLVTVDVLYALATLLTLLAALAFAREPAYGRAAALGLALGLAFSTKFSAFLLVLGLLLLPLASPPDSRGLWRNGKRIVACALIVAGLTVVVVDLAYLGKGAAFLEGLSRSLGAERGWGPVVLLGRAPPDGVFYYFAVLWALKTPLLLLLAQAAGLWLVTRSGRLVRDPALRFLAFNLALTLFYFSFLFKTQIGYRFVLMAIPLAWILAAAGLSSLTGRRARRLGALALLVALAENLAYLGNPLSFTNAALQPKRRAFRLLADSNIDWGQNREKIPGWLAGRGIRASRLDPVHLLAGPNVFSLNVAAGVFDFEQHRWLRAHADPIEHLGHTYLRFEIENEVFDRFMDEERRLEPSATSRGLCPEDLGYEPQPPGSQRPFVRVAAPEPQRVWAACVNTERGIDLGLRMAEGRLRFGRFTPDRRCQAALLQDEQVVWYRLLPGTHALCAVEVPNRRAFLPYRVDATFIVRGQAAALHIRPLSSDASGSVQP